VEKHGPNQWNFLANSIPGRTGKQCRERWCNHLCPDINKSSWSLEEEMLLLLIHDKIGNKWSEISKYLKGRTDNTIKNHWNSTMKKRLVFVEESLKNKKIEIKNRYKETNEANIETLIIDEFKIIIETQMKKVIEDKQKNYENFKKIKIDDFCANSTDINNLCQLYKEDNDNNGANKNISLISKRKEKETNDINNSIYKLRKILGFRTHSKKRKKNNINKNRTSSSKKGKQWKLKLENKNRTKELINDETILNENDNSYNNNINNNIIKKQADNYYLKTPNMKQIITKISSSINETEDNSGGINKKSSSDSNLSAFRCINREDNSSDKKYLLSQKFTPVKIITPFEIDIKEDDVRKKDKNNDNIELKTKKNLSLLFNNIE
jgi:hypothetical protein